VKLIQGSMKRSTRSKIPRGPQWAGWAYLAARCLQAVVLFKFADPMLDIGGRIPLGVLSGNFRNGAEESSSSFGDQLLCTV
jgi:hypothetical protein